MKPKKTMRIGQKGLDLIKSFESFVPYVYDDLVAPVKGRYREWDGGVVKGTLTIGYGHTDAAKHPLKITQGLRISESEALEILDVDLDECEDAVNALVKVPLTQGQFDALTSFAFNCGTGNLKKLIVPLNRGDYDACRRKFDEFIRSKGQVLRGLVRRRDAEQALWDDRYDDVLMPEAPVAHPADVDTPEPKPMTQSTIANGATVGGGFTLASLGATVWDKFVEAPDGLQHAIIRAAGKPAFWFILAAAIACAFIWWRRKRMQEAA
jgi:GH24 family phage-related lysozyme (muramidase)